MEPGPDKIQHLVCDFFCTAGELDIKKGQALFDETAKVEVKTLFLNDAYDPQGLSSQGMGIGCPRGDETDGEASHNIINLVGNAHYGPRD